MFRSPSGYGIKILFMLKHSISNTKHYSVFYKAFSLAFSKKYQLEKALDMVTSDATRVCFISADFNSYHNPRGIVVDESDYISPMEDVSLNENDSEMSEQPLISANSKNNGDDQILVLEQESSIDKEVMYEISRLLSPNPSVIKKTKQHYIPPQLMNIESHLTSFLNEYGIELENSAPIQYGKQIRFRFKNSFSELNIFYGKNGYSIVKTTRKGFCPMLADRTLQLVGAALLH